MTTPLRRLPKETRHALRDALAAGRIGPRYTSMAVQRTVGKTSADEIAVELSRLAAIGMTPKIMCELLTLLEEDSEPLVSLVWSGPETTGAETRDTGVVMRELFARATRSVLIAGFAVYQGKNVFKVLADRMDAESTLAVRMFLNVEREYGDTTSAAELLKDFADRFRMSQWPGKRLPVVFHDPRAIQPFEKGKRRAALHAKCVVVDDGVAFVTSANFTEAAQERNIETGVLVEERSFARSLSQQFDALVHARLLVPVPGLT